MKTTTFLTGTVVLSSIFLGSVGAAQAATLTNSYLVKGALSDSYHNANHNHLAWLNSLPGQNDYLADGDVIFNEYDDGTAHLLGTVKDEFNSNLKYQIDVWFQETTVGWGGPKKELNSSAYSNNGGPIDTDTWSYYDIITQGEKASKLTGLGGNAGQGELFISDASGGKYPMQIGFGANGKNDNYGFSTWFVQDGGSGHSDFNVDLIKRPLPPSKNVPEPTMGLALAGLAGAGALRRKKKGASK